MDNSFPKDDVSPTEPSRIVINRIQYSMDVISNYYKGIGKLAVQRQFDVRLLDGERMVDLTILESIMDKPRTALPVMLSELENVFKKSFEKTHMAPRLTHNTVSFNILFLF